MEKNSLRQIKLLVLVGIVFIIGIGGSVILLTKGNAESTTVSPTLWPYQCIDTMKTSRDKARLWKTRNDLHNSTDKQAALIKDLGGNCIAIDTPYDKEFLPYLHQWVISARKQHLHIWFRGNFSGWEGWFDYPKGLTSQKLFTQTKEFIEQNPDLFQDGDIFTPAPEAENGGPFNQVEPSRYKLYRQFLRDEYTLSQDSFKAINKKIIVNWFSMNGGFARRMLDQETVDSLGGNVTIDHYINNPARMTDYISYFAKTFHASVVIGEFGAPIPEFNGTMTEDEQADFIDKLLWEMYRNRKDVFGINYWVLYDSSTALINENGTNRKVTTVIKKYFRPLTISGIIKNSQGQSLANIPITTSDKVTIVQSDKSGKYTLTIPNGDVTLLYGTAKDKLVRKIHASKDTDTHIDITIVSQIHKTLWDKVREIFHSLGQYLHKTNLLGIVEL